MKTKIGLLSIFIILLIIGCINKEKQVPKDKFYANTGGWGEMRFPLIKPFYMFCYDGKNWLVYEDELDDYDDGGCSIFEVKRLQMLKDLFLFRSYGDSLAVTINGERQSEGWFVMDVKHKTINGYTDYTIFKDTLYSRYRITNIDTLLWRTPRSYYEEFKKERFMPWFPDSIVQQQ
ncbi:MAG: hypothetical protein ACOXZH_07920 [Bacteroidales bacterium]|jgi:hypothetical protein|nr:hypothetical protein [Bacteroidales bacterium]